MSGQKGLTASERLARFEKATEDYINSKHLCPIGFNIEAIEVLNLTVEELKILSSEECVAKSYVVFAYANYLQEEHNLNLVKLNYANDSLREIVAAEVGQFDKYMKHEIKQQNIINNNEFASKLDNIRKHAQARVDKMTEKIRDIRRMGESLLELAKRKAYS